MIFFCPHHHHHPVMMIESSMANIICNHLYKIPNLFVSLFDLSECGCGTGVAFHIHRNTRMTRWLHRSRILEVLDLCLWQRYTGEVLLTGCQNAWHVLWTKHYDDYMMYTMQIHDIIIYLQYVLLILFVFNSCFIKVMQAYMIPGVCVPMPEGWYLL